jgi:hypothetical protein
MLLPSWLPARASLLFFLIISLQIPLFRFGVFFLGPFPKLSSHQFLLSNQMIFLAPICGAAVHGSKAEPRGTSTCYLHKKNCSAVVAILALCRMYFSILFLCFAQKTWTKISQLSMKPWKTLGSVEYHPQAWVAWSWSYELGLGDWRFSRCNLSFMEKRGSYPQEMDCFRVARVLQLECIFFQISFTILYADLWLPKNHMQFSLMGLNAYFILHVFDYYITWANELEFVDFLFAWMTIGGFVIFFTCAGSHAGVDIVSLHWR